MRSQQNTQAIDQSEKIWTRDFVLICLANFSVFLGFQMTLPTLPLFVKELGGSDQSIGIIVGIFTFSALLLRPYAGKALETRGRRFVFLTGLIIFVLSLGVFGFITSIALLIFIRIIQGVGWGFSNTATGTIATDLVPKERRGEGLGYFGLSGNIALAFGPSLGLTLAGVMSFKSLYLICAACGLTAFLLSTKIRYKKVEAMPEKSTTVKFDIFEKTAVKPSVLLFLITVTFGGIASFLPLYAAEKGIAGIEGYFLVYALFLMISRTFAGQIYDKKGHEYVFLPGAVLIFTAMLLLSWLPNIWVMLFAAMLYGLGFGSVQPTLQAWAMNSASEYRRGMANATFFSFFDLGVGLGAMTFGTLASVFGYYSIYVTAAGSVMLSMILYTVLLIRAKKAGPE